MTKIITISLNEADFLLIKERNISPSALFRTTLDRIRKQINPETTLSDQQWAEKLQRMVTTVQQLNNFLEKEKLTEKFYKHQVEMEED